jgi:hypothetical protein
MTTDEKIDLILTRLDSLERRIPKIEIEPFMSTKNPISSTLGLKFDPIAKEEGLHILYWLFGRKKSKRIE